MKHALVCTLAVGLALLALAAAHQAPSRRPALAVLPHRDPLPPVEPLGAVHRLRVCPCNYRIDPPVPCTCPGGECACGAFCWCQFPGPRCRLVAASCDCQNEPREMCTCPDDHCPCAACKCCCCAGK